MRGVRLEGRRGSDGNDYLILVREEERMSMATQRSCQGSLGGLIGGHGPHEWVHDPTDQVFWCPGRKPDVNGGAHALLAKLAEDEPVFVIRAQDILAPQILAMYAELARKVGLPDHAQEVEARAVQMMQWQARNAKRVKRPD